MGDEPGVEIENIFTEAAALDAGARAALLDARCADRPELRREVESLLESHDKLGDFLKVGTAVLPPASTPSRERHSRVGDLVAHYRLVERIGSGSMGVVYRAEDRALGREAAIKLIPDTLQPKLRERVLTEPEAIARLQHPSIATFYEAGSADGESFIAMEFVRGPTLRERLRSGPIAFVEAMALAQCLLEAVAHAHAAGLLHRDIKPDNVMLVAPTVAKLLDFGIAIPLTAFDAPRAGTVGYLAPEQLTGGPLDVRTDVFQVGVVLYEMLTGRPLFRGESRLERLAAGTSPPDLTALDAAAIPRSIAACVERAVAHDAAARYESAAAFLRALREADSAERPSIPAAAGGAATREDEPARREADQYFNRARLMIEGFGKGSLEDARDLLERAIAIDPRHADALAALTIAYALRSIASPNAADFERAIACADRALAIDDRHLRSWVWKAYALSALGRHSEADTCVRRSLEIDPDDTEALYFAAGARLFWHQPPLVREAITLLRRAIRRDETRGMWWLALGATHGLVGHDREALYCYRRAQRLEGTPTRFNTAGAAAYAGESLRRLNRLEEARAAAYDGLEAAEQSDHAYRDTFRAHALIVIGRIAIDERHLGAADAAFQQVLAQARGRPQPRASGHFVVQALAGLARVTGHRSSLDEAARVFERRETFNFAPFYGAVDGDSLGELALAAQRLGLDDEATGWAARARDAGASRSPFVTLDKEVRGGSSGPP